MIAGVRGLVAGKVPGAVLIDLHGLIVQVLTSNTTLSDLGDIGTEAELVTQLYVREDQITLFGFASREELDLFRLLLGVNGVGPKAALSILSTAPPAELAAAIDAGEADLLTRAPGIGKRTASRIILDLRGKLPELAPAMLTDLTPRDLDALAALQALGYTAAEARQALGRVESAAAQTVEERVFAALQVLARG